MAAARGRRWGRGGGIDLTFSAPKSVSRGVGARRGGPAADMEAAHAAAVSEAMAHLTETVPTVRRRYSGQVVEEPAREVVAAEYRHTTARGVLEGDAPDPQLHSHVVITSAIRDDGRIVAVASRPVFRSAREMGAYYRSALAHQLSERGYAIEAGTGKHGRYFEIAGVPQGLLEAFSARSREVARAAERFRAKWGRAPERGELRRLKLENRKAKVLVTRADLHAVWNDTAARFDFTGDEPARLLGAARGSRPERALEDRVEERLTERAATFEPGEFRAVLLEQSVGELSPREALAFSRSMIAERRVLPLEGGSDDDARGARPRAGDRAEVHPARPGGRPRRRRGRTRDRKRHGRRADRRTVQRRADPRATGHHRPRARRDPGRTRGHREGCCARRRRQGRAAHGASDAGCRRVLVDGRASWRDSPALSQQVFSVDALVSRVEHGQVNVDADTTIYFDEAGMADTDRLDRLTEIVERTGAKLVAIGDAAQLPSIGAGGMFDRLARIAPSAELSDVRRTLDPQEQRAWADLRAGRSDRAMAHYHSRGQLHMADTSDEAVEHAVQSWAKLTENHPIGEVALISDASNQEIHRLNARAQHYRAQSGELGELEVEVPGVHYGIRQGDRVAMIEQHHEPGAERIENGSQGEVLHITPAGEALIEFDITGRRRTLAGEDLGRVRLGYAHHIHRAQGATVTRTLVVTGGWQTSKEPAYVEASRARQGTDWFVSREDLGAEGHDTDRIQRLAPNMRRSHAQTPSLAHPELPDPEYGPRLPPPVAPSRPSRLPGIARAINRIVQPDRSIGRGR